MANIIDWKPFQVAPPGEKADPIRSLQTPEGIEDRLRSAAFAELQAQKAFLWAAEFYTLISPKLKRAWVHLAQAEERHLHWLLSRMEALQLSISQRKVSQQLWLSLISCPTAEQFAHYMASAEERGRKANLHFFQTLQQRDPLTADIFKKIAQEEIAHIELAYRFFPKSYTPVLPNPPSPRKV